MGFFQRHVASTEERHHKAAVELPHMWSIACLEAQRSTCPPVTALESFGAGGKRDDSNPAEMFEVPQSNGYHGR
jgi:hypothetical protein